MLKEEDTRSDNEQTKRWSMRMASVDDDARTRACWHWSVTKSKIVIFRKWGKSEHDLLDTDTRGANRLSRNRVSDETRFDVYSNPRVDSLSSTWRQWTNWRTVGGSVSLATAVSLWSNDRSESWSGAKQIVRSSRASQPKVWCALCSNWTKTEDCWARGKEEKCNQDQWNLLSAGWQEAESVCQVRLHCYCTKAGEKWGENEQWAGSWSLSKSS